MLSRHEFEALEVKILAPYAMRTRDSRGREFQELEHPYRSAFQRDRDRIIHSSAFRRLEYKTQVFVIHEGDDYRTRLTHTMEAAQIARTLARTLRLNEDLTEAVTLAHDLGHTPFGHSGEGVLDGLLRKKFGKKFEHNRQSLRIVEKLEHRYPHCPGLNLTYEVRESLAKHHSNYDLVECEARFKPAQRSLLECRLSNMADEIAYTSHDLDDGLASGLITTSQLKDVVLWKELIGKAGSRQEGLDEERFRFLIVRAYIDLVCTDLMRTTEAHLEAHKIRSVADVRRGRHPLVSFSPSMLKKNNQLKKFLYTYMYRHYKVVRMEEKAKMILTRLFQAYTSRDDILPPSLLARREHGTSLGRIIADYIASMTDRFAQEEYKRLTDPFERV